jgi:hypothetical protein
MKGSGFSRLSQDAPSLIGQRTHYSHMFQKMEDTSTVMFRRRFCRYASRIWGLQDNMIDVTMNRNSCEQYSMAWSKSGTTSSRT